MFKKIPKEVKDTFVGIVILIAVIPLLPFIILSATYQALMDNFSPKGSEAGLVALNILLLPFATVLLLFKQLNGNKRK